MTWIQTYTGRAFSYQDVIDGKEPDICLLDIAVPLSNLCRFAGHCPAFYSVAEHTVLVASIAAQDPAIDDEPLRQLVAQCALLHDAAEAYVCDLPKPLKSFQGAGEFYPRLEELVSKAIFRHFSVEPSQVAMDIVKRADVLALAVEKSAMFPESPRDWEIPECPPGFQVLHLSPTNAKWNFLEACMRAGFLERTANGIEVK